MLQGSPLPLAHSLVRYSLSRTRFLIFIPVATGTLSASGFQPQFILPLRPCRGGVNCNHSLLVGIVAGRADDSPLKEGKFHAYPLHRGLDCCHNFSLFIQLLVLVQALVCFLDMAEITECTAGLRYLAQKTGIGRYRVSGLPAADLQQGVVTVFAGKFSHLQRQASGIRTFSASLTGRENSDETNRT